MEKEYLRSKLSSLSVNVAAGEVESLRKLVEEKTTVRVYEDGFIGIAGQIGSDSLDKLEEDAIANLANKLPYPCMLSENVVVDKDCTKPIFNPDDFLKISRHLLARMKEEMPQFLFNNKIQYYETEREYSNSKGTKLTYKGNEYVVALTAKDKASANLMDMVFSVNDDVYDEDLIIAGFKRQAEAYFKPADIPVGKYKVIISPSELIGTSLQHFIGELYASGASLFSGKLEQKLFSEKLDVLLDRSGKGPVNISFFDDEGEIADGGKSYLVKDGVLCGLLTSKKISATLGLPLSKSASAAYDGVPSVGASGLDIGCCDKTLAELVGDDKAVYVAIASGGDTTSDGDFATPVQTAFLYEKGRLVGRLPDIKIYGNIFDFLGDGYVGSTRRQPGTLGSDSLSVVYMNVDK